MVNKKRNPIEIGAAIGYLSNFIGPLIESLIEAGGKPEMLYFAQREHAKPMMELLAKTIVESGLWKVPKSLIIREVTEDISMPEITDDSEEGLERHWCSHSSTAEWITTVRLCDEMYSGSTGVVPDYLWKIIGRDGLKCGDTIEWKDKLWVITLIDFDKDVDYINRYLYLAPAEWIDLEN